MCNVKNIVVSGMGGSASAVSSSAVRATPTPIRYILTIPGYVNADSLVLLSSYSGTTEETLAAAEQAKSRAKIAVITSGGKRQK